MQSDPQAIVPAFDPLAGLFAAQDQRPAALGPVRVDRLTPLLRALLATDGTVTSFLQAWALEPVEVRPVRQRQATLPEASRWLEAPAGTAILERAVVLTGAHSRRLYAWAESLICTTRLPAGLLEGLLGGSLSLGQLLLTPGFESRREGLWYGRESPATVPEAVKALGEADFLTRTYRVTSGTRPLMLITERFPWRPEAT